MPTLSIIIPVKNGAKHIEKCLSSIFRHTKIKDFEVIVVDNFSTDGTDQISQKYPIRFFQKGPERHAQRRLGAQKSTGKCLYFLDADMHAQPGLIDEIINHYRPGYPFVSIVGEEPYGANNFWTRAKILERELCQNDDLVEAARVFDRNTYQKVGGFDASMIAMEDWDLTIRCRKKGINITRTMAKAGHNEGYVTLQNLAQKKSYYASESKAFIAENGWGEVLRRFYFFRPGFWKKTNYWRRFPLLTIGVFIIFIVESGAAVFGFWWKKKSRKAITSTKGDVLKNSLKSL